MLLRRSLLQSGAAALAVPHRADAAYLIFGSSLRAGTRQFSVPNNIVNDTTNNSLNSRMTCFAPANTAITGLQISFPGFGFNNPEAVLPNGYAVTAAIEYPAGTFTPLTVSGSRTLTVTPSERLYSYDFLPISIPAGAAFYVKTFVQWTVGNFWMCSLCASFLLTDWTIAGTNLSDNTLTTTTFLSTSINYGFGPSVYASFAGPQKTVGVIGDSVAYAGGADTWDPTTGSRFYERAMRNVLPIINLARGSDSFVRYLQMNQGRRLMLIGLIDSLICGYGRNDISAGASLATMQTRAQTTWADYQNAGIAVRQATITPQTTSTDGWATTANQTVADPAAESVRVAFNAWIRANWASLGLSGYLDNAWAIDPSDTGLWSADGTTGTGAAAFCTLTGGVVTAASVAVYQQNGKGTGNSYPHSSVVPCTVRGYPGETGILPVITGNAASNGLVTSYNIVSPGSGLLYPPMVAGNGAWTPDGTHPNARGYNECIYYTNLGPTLLA